MRVKAGSKKDFAQNCSGQAYTYTLSSAGLSQLIIKYRSIAYATDNVDLNCHHEEHSRTLASHSARTLPSTHIQGKTPSQYH